MKNNNSNRNNHNNINNNNNNNNPHVQNDQNDRRKQYHQQQQQHQNSSFHNQSQRERSGQRNQGGPHPDSSMSRDNTAGSSLGSIKFTPGYPTRELPPIETKADPNKKFTGRCRLFVGNLPHNTTEEQLRSLFEPYGEVGEVYLGPKSAFGFVKMDSRQSSETARDALDCSMFEGRTLRVRLAAHAAAIRVKHLSPQVTNELLAYAFRYFGEIERAVVVVDDKGKSIGEGVVEYSRKQSALFAIKRCQAECFMLTASPKPVLVEPFDQHDEDEGLPEKSINKNSIEFKEERDIGPRFAEQSTFEHTFGMRWKELYDIEKQKRDRLEQEIQEARKNLQDQIAYSRLEHDTVQLRSRLQQLEDDRLKLQQLKEQSLSGANQREDQRRQQDLALRQREEGVLRRQQLGDPSGLNQQEMALRMQANVLQDLLSQDRPGDGGDQSQQKSQCGPSTGTEVESSIPVQVGMMQMPRQPTYADATMMGIAQNPFNPYQQMMIPQATTNQQMGPQGMYTGVVPPSNPIADSTYTPSFVANQPGHGYGRQNPRIGQNSQGGPNRNQKFSQAGNNISVIQTADYGRPRKRGRQER